jgi:hypothetical protein
VQKVISANHYRGVISANKYEKATLVWIDWLIFKVFLHSCHTQSDISLNKYENAKPVRMNWLWAHFVLRKFIRTVVTSLTRTGVLIINIISSHSLPPFLLTQLFMWANGSIDSISWLNQTFGQGSPTLLPFPLAYLTAFPPRLAYCLSPSPSFSCRQMALLATYPNLTKPLGRAHPAYSLSPLTKLFMQVNGSTGSLSWQPKLRAGLT